LAQTVGVIERLLQVSITTEGILLRVCHLGVRSLGFGDPLPASRFKIRTRSHRNQTSSDL
jgi:hypothetical protein